MHLNMNKTKCTSMLITTAQKRSRLVKKEIDLILNGNKIENVCKQKLLGVHIDQHLAGMTKWTMYIKWSIPNL